MNRRKFIAAGSTAAATTLAGCYGVYRYITNDEQEYEEKPYPDELPSNNRVDTPPYEIPEQGESENDWNPNYLGTNLSTTPSINFTTRVDASLSDKKIDIRNMEESNEYLVRVIDNESTMNDILNTGSEIDIDFNEEILLVIESGFGSSSLIQRWNRVEETANGIHIHGYMYKPFNHRLDFKSRSSVVKVERPDNIDNITAYVSLTVDREFRINFNSDEDIVRIPVIG